MIGLASMCWSEAPRGVFDSATAKMAGDTIMERVNNPGFALEVLRKAMMDREPGSCRDGWKANIAMAFIDQVNLGPDNVRTSEGLHAIANKAANVFLDRLLSTLDESEFDGMAQVMHDAREAKA